MAIGGSFGGGLPGLGAGGIIALPTLVQRIAVDHRAVDTAATKVGGSLQSILPVAARVGVTLTRTLSVPLLAIGALAARAAVNFESAFSKIEGLVGVAADEVARLREQTLALAGEVGKGPQELADALFFVTSAGFRGAEAMKVLESSAKASTAGLGDVATIADAVTSAVNAYGQEVLSAASATDVLVAAVREGKLEASALAPVLGQILPTASALGVSFADVAGTLAVFSRTGTEAAQGATQITSILSSLLNTSPQVKQALDEVGLSMEELRQQASEEGLIAVMRTLDTALEGNVEALRQVIPNVRALRGVLGGLAQDGESVDSILQGVAESAGATERAFATAEESARVRFAKVLADIQSGLIGIGQGVVLGIEPLVQGIASLARGFSGLPGPVREFLGQMGIMLAMLGPGLLLFVGITRALIGLRAAVEGLALGRAVLAMVGLGSAADQAAAGVTRLSGALRLLGVAGLIFALTQLKGKLDEIAESGELLASQDTDLVLTREERDEQVERVRAVLGEVEALGEAKRRVSDEPFEFFGEQDFVAEVESKVKEVEAILARPRSFLHRVFPGLSQDSEEAKRLAESLLEVQAAAQAAADAGVDVPGRLLTIGDDAVEMLRGMGVHLVEGINTNIDSAIDLGRRSIEAQGDLLRRAVEAGLDPVETALLIARGEIDKVRDALEATGAAGQAAGLRAAQGWQTFNQVLVLTGEELDKANARLQARADAIQRTFGGITSGALSDTMDSFADATRAGTANVRSATNDLAEEARRVQEIFTDITSGAISHTTSLLAEQQRAQEELIREREEFMREQARRHEEQMREQARRSEAIFTQIVSPRFLRDLLQDEEGNIIAPMFADFERATASNLRHMRRFFENLRIIAANGGQLLASELSKMGVEGMLIAQEAVDRIASGEGVGALEGQLRQALLEAKRFGIDQTLLEYKPNIEEESQKNIVDPFKKTIEEADLFESFADAIRSGRVRTDQFFSDLKFIAENGGEILAQTLAGMGEQGAEIARQAVQRIVSGEGIGALEGELRASLHLAKTRGLDPAIQKFKPNIESEVDANIAKPLRSSVRKAISDAELFEGFSEALGRRTAETAEFFANLVAIAESGAPLLAAMLSEMGDEGVKLAREAVKRIASGEGLGALEADARQALLVSKAAMDQTLRKFKPNLEGEMDDNIVTPIRTIIASLEAEFDAGKTAPEALLAGIGAIALEIEGAAAAFGQPIDDMQRQLLDLARTTKDPEEGILALKVAAELFDDTGDRVWTKAQQDLLKTATTADTPAERLRALHELLDSLGRVNAEPSVGLDDGVFVGKVNFATGALTDLGNVRAVPTLDMNIDPFVGKVKFAEGTMVDFITATNRALTEAESASLHIGLAFHTGGMVPRFHGGGSPLMSLGPREVPAILEQGEYVTNAESTRRWLPVLQYINRHHEGGFIGDHRNRVMLSASQVPPSLRIDTLNIELPFGWTEAREHVRALAEHINRELEDVWRSR